MKVNLQSSNQIPRESKMKKACDHPATLTPLSKKLGNIWLRLKTIKRSHQFSGNYSEEWRRLLQLRRTDLKI